MKRVIYFLSLLLVSMSVTSCNNYLEEKSYGTDTSAFLTEEGAESMVNMLYFRLKYYGYGSFNFGELMEQGTDIWLRGGNSRESALSEYRGLDANNQTCAEMWNHYYKGLWDAHYFWKTVIK